MRLRLRARLRDALASLAWWWLHTVRRYYPFDCVTTRLDMLVLAVFHWARYYRVGSLRLLLRAAWRRPLPQSRTGP